MGWLLSAGQAGAKNAARMRLASAAHQPGWSFSMASPAPQRGAKIWQTVLSGLTQEASEQNVDKGSNDEH
jgi:hypothetical protein